MRFSEKLVMLRKDAGLSQEQLAEKLNISRQAVSRWESGTAMPDATNLLSLSNLFAVSVDQLLRDERDVSKVDKAITLNPKQNMTTLLIVLIALEVLALLLQVIAVFVTKNILFAFLSFLPFVGVVAGFEVACRRCGAEAFLLRSRFYIWTVWLGAYFPLRLVLFCAAILYPRPYYSLVFEALVLLIYLLSASLLTRKIRHSVTS